ncbi:MAG: hypothetical protein R3313_03935 [Candidatus Saccharimonadales bacterium]|nr:hypothetical protein [Candidatus Saccharimonadales bacterium]
MAWIDDALNSLSDIPEVLQGIAAIILAWGAVFKAVPKINRKNAPSDLLNLQIKSLIKKYYASAEGIAFSLKDPEDRKKIINRVIEVNSLDKTKEVKKLVEDNVTELLERGYY